MSIHKIQGIDWFHVISIVIDLCLRQDKSIIHVEVCYFSLSD